MVTFDEMINHLNEGFNLNFKTQELNNLFEKAKKILIWTMQAVNLIKRYEPTYKSKLLTESSSDPMFNIHNIPSLMGDEYKEIFFLTTDGATPNFQSQEFDKLIELRNKSEQWSQKSREILAKKIFHEETIKDLLKKAETFPVENALRTELREINQLLNWVNRANSVISSTQEHKTLIQTLQDSGTKTLQADLALIPDFHKSDCIKFLITHRPLISNLLKIISSPDTKFKADPYSLDYIDNLLAESQKITIPQEH